MLEETILFSPLVNIAKRIRSREISPVELTSSYLDRLERFSPMLNAVVTIVHERAMEDARQAEREIQAGNYRGPLHGIPYGAKDLLATQGIRTTWGAPPFRDQVFDFDATVISRLQSAGAVLIGKLSMLELAGVGHYRYASASLTGPGLNPWNPTTYTGGSSSGPASATAAGLVGFSIGSETWGSILTPASFCGLSGLRPTYGRVSRYGAMTLSWTMDKLGPMCRSVEDCLVVLSAIAGYDPKDPSTLAEEFTCGSEVEHVRGIRIGVVQDGFDEHGEPEVKRGFHEAMHVLTQAGADLHPVSLPTFPYHEVAEVIVASEAACAFERLIETGRIGELVDTAQQAGILAGTKIKAVDYLKAMRLRTLLKAEFASVWKDYDVLIGPTSLTVSPPIQGSVHDLYLTYLITAGNLLGMPGITVPCGFGRGKLPIGLSVVGPPLEDAKIARIAQLYQEATTWHRLYPPLFTNN
jgi:aspartyl-tRNA(Asn)/glutamyl-tRNA(Gln) amidotransferase subunit A